MRALIDLVLIRDNLAALTETPYFNSKLSNFLQGLTGAITHVIDAKPPLSSAITSTVAGVAWLSHSYLHGSTSRDIPYELAFCLEKAIRDWVSTGGIVTTTLTDDKNYHLMPADPWKAISTAIPSYSGSRTHEPLVMIGLPRLYRHKPIYCIPLYHELGHFVDNELGITKAVILKLLQMKQFATADDQKIATRHFQEYFADLFASCYVGTANLAVLNTFAPNQPATFSHPSTADRQAVISAFLEGRADKRLDLIQEATLRQAGKKLTVRFAAPSVKSAFDDVRPVDLANDSELHGIFQSAWDYLVDAIDNRTPEWTKVSGFPESKIEAVVNDLVEKSIRNLSITEKWRNANP